MGNSFRQTIAGLFADPRMKPSVMLNGHLQSTRERIKADGGEYILAIQDTTYYNYSSHRAMQGLGRIQGELKGVIQHNILMANDQGVPLGILGQEYWSRESERSYPGKESEKWHWGLERVNEELGASGKKVVLMQDREADIYSFLEAERAEGVELLVRVHQPRMLEIDASGEQYKLNEIGDCLPVAGEKEVIVLRQGKEVRLVISLKAVTVHVLAGKHNSPQKKAETLSLVIAEEVAAFDPQGKNIYQAQERAIWYLLTSLSIDNLAQVEQITEFYAKRWLIERFHYTLKSGALDVEKMQFDDLSTTINALTFHSIVAWQILAIVYLTRAGGEQNASACFEKKEVQILETVNKKPLRTVKEATLALAKLAGFAPSKKQPMPGIKLLAQALERFHYIKMGFHAKPS